MLPQEQREKIAVIGVGWVGKAMLEMFPNAYPYSRSLGDQTEVNRREIAFVCVPTPCPKEGALDTSAVEEIIKWCECPLIVVRSTVNPGDCDGWMTKYKKNIVHQPEYLGETPNHPLLDSKNVPFIIMGGRKKDTRKLIELYTTVYNANVKIRQVNCRTSEVIKLTENRAIGFKVAECQELYDSCERDGVDYYEVRDAVYGDDPRFNLWWTFIYPDKRGFNSKCIPKDIYAWCAWAEETGYKPELTRALLKSNKQWITT